MISDARWTVSQVFSVVEAPERVYHFDKRWPCVAMKYDCCPPLFPNRH